MGQELLASELFCIHISQMQCAVAIMIVHRNERPAAERTRSTPATSRQLQTV